MRTGITGGEGNEGWCCRVVNTARTVRASRGRHNPLPAVAPRERRDGDASAPPPHGPPTYRERVAVPGWAGLISVCKTGHMGLSVPTPTRNWALLFARSAEEARHTTGKRIPIYLPQESLLYIFHFKIRAYTQTNGPDARMLTY